MKMHEGLRAARGIRDPDIEAALAETARIVRFHASHEVIEKTKLYIEIFRSWITASRLNTITGLEAFPHSTFAHGSSQVFDHFLLKHASRRLRYFNGEFAYHRVLAQAGKRPFLPLEDARIHTNDVVVISAPFSDTGDWHPAASRVLDEAHENKVPVLLDLAYLGTCYGLKMNLDHPAVHELAFSLSKWIPALAQFRIGLRCSREILDDGLAFAAQVGMTNVASTELGLCVLKKFDLDYIPGKYRAAQLRVCSELGLTPSPSVMFGIGGAEFQQLNRGGLTNRACISSLIETESI